MSFQPNITNETPLQEPVAVKEDRKQKKRKEVNEDVEEMAQALFIYWKVKELMKTGVCQYEEANERAESMWRHEMDDATLDLFRKAAAVQIVILGGEFIPQKKRKHQRNDVERNRAECNPFLLFCKDHIENVREKGSRGKGMTTLSTMWKQLTDKEKEKYVEMAKQNKNREIIKTGKLVESVIPPPAQTEPPSQGEMNYMFMFNDTNDMDAMHGMPPLPGELPPTYPTINTPPM